MSDLDKWFSEYVEHMYPDAEVTAGRSQYDLDAMVHTARVRACWIVDRLIDTRKYRELS